ncbi:MAG: DUF3846 domain-containing protein [Clostridia bacterium]|nr:DUF3846 domain-containing protein [Clostridia bacterium]
MEKTKKQGKIRAIVKKPGAAAYSAPIDNELGALQREVGGLIETVTLAKNFCVICNEEGRILGLDFNVWLCGVDFYGPILLVGFDGEYFCDLPMTYSEAKEFLPPSFFEESEA